MSRTFLVCQDELHGELVDQLIAEKLRDEQGTICSGWSGVWTDGVRHGVLWGSPVSDLFGVPDIDPSLVLVEETEDAPWSMVEPVADEAPSL